MTQKRIFKSSLKGLNSEVSFSQTGCHTEVKEPDLGQLFIPSWKEKSWIHTFPKCVGIMLNANRLLEDLNSD